MKQSAKTFFLSLTGTIILSSCCYNKPIDVSFKPVTSATERNVETLTSEKYPDHFLACRADATVADNRQRVDSIIEKLKHNKKDVILYFHGGLSGQEYMVNKLGPWLMESMFDQKAVTEKLYPIFVNYDASPLDIFFKADESQQKHSYWNHFKTENEVMLNSEGYKHLESQFKQALGFAVQTTDKEIEANNPMWRAKAANIALGLQRSHNKKMPTNYFLSDAERDYLLSILDERREQDDFFGPNKTSTFDSNHTVIQDLAAPLKQLQEEHKIRQVSAFIGNDNAKVLETKIISHNWRVLRILARFALGLDHGFFATIQEETLQQLHIGKLGKLHWNGVKKHSKQCFTDNSVGQYLIDSLLALKDNNGLKINTLSHSAGSIPTAQLIDYVGNKDEGQLDSIVMLVPAVNQLTFETLISKHESAYEELTIFSLTQKKEKEDKVGSDLLYSSSLLYAVSSLAETSPALDTLLLLDQHIEPTRAIYSNKTYQCIVDEKPKNVWDLFDSANKKYRFNVYPFKASTEPHPDAATHEGTKYPWQSSDLAKKYLEIFKVDDVERLTFPVPKGFKHSGLDDVN